MSDSLWPYGLPHAWPQTHVHWVGDTIQPSHPLLSPSPAFNLSQHQGLFQWVSSLHQVAKVLEFQLQHQSFQCVSLKWKLFFNYKFSWFRPYITILTRLGYKSLSASWNQISFQRAISYHQKEYSTECVAASLKGMLLIWIHSRLCYWTQVWLLVAQKLIFERQVLIEIKNIAFNQKASFLGKRWTRVPKSQLWRFC